MKFKSLPILAGAAVVAALVAATPQARADVVDPIVAIANATSTNVTTGIGGITYPAQLSLMAIENGSEPLTFGSPASGGCGSAPCSSGNYLVTNDFSTTQTSITFSWTGTIAENQFINIQENGAFTSAIGTLSPNNLLCTTCGGQSTSAQFFTPVPGGSGSTQGPVFTETYTWTGVSIAPGAEFDITFASFANGDTTVPVPAPLIGHGLFVLLAVGGVLFGGKLLESFKNRHLQAA
jgi:hypothetical protein